MSQIMNAFSQFAAGSVTDRFTWESAFPALVAFVGVLVGGAINVAAQRRNFNEEQVALIRERVAELAVNVQEYTTAAMQGFDTLQEHAVKTDEYGVITLNEHGAKIFAVVGNEFFSLYRKAYVLSIRLMSARDRKIADQAQVVQDALSQFHDDVDDIFEYRLTESQKSLDEKRAKLLRTCNQMLNMIEPRFFESFLRIRSIKSATKILDAMPESPKGTNENITKESMQ